jgi:hypothetical protein
VKLLICLQDYGTEQLQPPTQQASYITLPLNLATASSSSLGDLVAAAQPLLQPLLDAAVPASFGKGKDSVYDPTYRTALELPASHVALNIPHPPAEILQQIHTLLQPSAAAVVADFYKLNVYGPGGFFKPHFDTPRSADMFGTLVVCLPSPHAGGELVLRHGTSSDASHTVDWSFDKPAAGTNVKKQSSGDIHQQLGSLQWAAFYSDTEHEVMPVTEGYRVTLTYNLRAVSVASSASGAAAAKLPEPSRPSTASIAAAAAGGAAVDTSWLTTADVASSAGLVAQLKQLLADERWHPEGGRISFVGLQHVNAAVHA